MPVRSDGAHLGPHWQIVRWRLARYGFLCFPHSDARYDGVVAYDGEGKFLGVNRNLFPSPQGGRVQAALANGLTPTYGNRYRHNGKRVVSWWGSPSKYIGTMNFSDARWDVFMTPLDPSGGFYDQQPTRFAETFYSDYFWISRPPDYAAEGPYQASDVAPAGTFANNGFPTGNSATYSIRPISPALRYQSRAVINPDSELGQLAGGAIIETSSGDWALAIEQPRWDINLERLVAARLDGSDRRVVLSWAWEIPEESPLAPEDSYLRNYGPWNFRPDARRAVAFRENLSRGEGNQLISDAGFYELSVGWNQSGQPQAAIQRLTHIYPPQAGDWMLTADRGLALLTEESAAALGTYGNGWGLTYSGTASPNDPRTIAGMDYDSDGVLRRIWTQASFVIEDGGAIFSDAPALVDDRGVACGSARLMHVDARDGLAIMRLICADGERYVIWWGGVLVWSTMLDLSLTPPGPLGGFAMSRLNPMVNGMGAVSRDGQYLAVSIPLVDALAEVPWDIGFISGGDWWTKRQWHTAVYRRDPATGDIAEVLSAAEIADLVGLPGANVRLHPVIPS